MNSPLTALAWEIWQRGRRPAWLAVGCVGFCAFINLVIIGKLHIPEVAAEVFPTLFGLLMVVSFFLMMGIFNYTEFNSTKEWNGFPYRLFTLPVRTWQLVALPMLLGVLCVEVFYFAWIKFVWTHDQIPLPEWFAVVFGAYVIFYQTAVWCLAGFRIARIVALGLGGVSGIAVAALPFFASIVPLPWFTEAHSILMMVALAAIAYGIAWAAVARQRCGGGRRRSWVNALANRLVDALPKCTKDFSSPAAAQFWFEWRRTGWVLPVCIAFVIAIMVPISWFSRHNPDYVEYILGRLLAAPVVLAFVVGKGFIKCEFWSTSFALPQFLAVRPLSPGEFVATKMKVAVVSVVFTWLLILGFIGLWLSSWANTENLKPQLFMFRAFYPHSWLLVTVLSCAGLMVLTWRLMVGGLWVGLSGSRSRYVGSAALQVLIPSLLLLAAGIASDAIDQEIKAHPVHSASIALTAMGWVLAVLVIAKFWFAAFAWSKTSPGLGRKYLLIWIGVTICFLSLAVLASPPFDTYRYEHLSVLGALLLFPVARLGLAPSSLVKNRHQ